MQPGDMVRIKGAGPQWIREHDHVGIITWASWKSEEKQSNYWRCRVLWEDGRHVNEDAFELAVVSETRTA